MESINNKQNQDDFTKSYNRYLELKWKLMFRDFKDEKEKEKLLKQKEKLEKEWKFEEEK